MTIADPPQPGLLDRLERWQWLLPVASFVTGCVSYVAIERGPALARVAALTVLASWLWLMVESTAGNWLQRISKGRLSARWAGFVTQSLQQELLFFSLPFVLGVSELDVAHGLFVTALAGAALISTLDPVYERWIARSASAAVAFQVYCTWVAAQVLLPVALHLPIERSAQAAAAVSAAAFVLALPRLFADQRGFRACWQTSVPILAALGLAALLTPWLPPAGLRVTESRMTTEVTRMVPGAVVKRIDVAALRSEGLIAFSAIHAPRGLTQKLSFDWYHGRQRVDSIPAVIQGTDDQGRGWRTWTRKQNFEGDPRGDWHVDIRTAGGQLVGRMRFDVTD